MKIFTGDLLAFAVFLTFKCADAVGHAQNNQNEFEGSGVRLQLGTTMYYGRLRTVTRQNQLSWQFQDQLDEPHVMIDVSGVKYTAQLNKAPELPASRMPQPTRRVIVLLADGSEPHADLDALSSSSNDNTHQRGPVGPLVLVKTRQGEDLAGALGRH